MIKLYINILSQESAFVNYFLRYFTGQL